MDIFSHGLWGAIAFGRRNRRSFWLALTFGVLPDLLAFGPHLVYSLVSNPDGLFSGRPELHTIPGYVFGIYNITHSFIVFTAVFLAVWLIREAPKWELGAWGLHVLVDIPTHSNEFFPTPFLWPVSDFTINGVSWGTPWIFFPNVITLAIIYIWYFLIRPRIRAKQRASINPE